MKSELATVNNQINTLLGYFASRKDVPEHFDAMYLNIWFMYPSMRY